MRLDVVNSVKPIDAGAAPLAALPSVSAAPPLKHLQELEA